MPDRSLRKALAASAEQRWGQALAKRVLYRRDRLHFEVVEDSADAGGDTLTVGIDDPGATMFSAWVALEAMIAGGMISSEIILDQIQIRCWRAREAVEAGVLGLQLTQGATAEQALCEILVIATDRQGGGLWRSRAYTMAELNSI